MAGSEFRGVKRERRKRQKGNSCDCVTDPTGDLHVRRPARFNDQFKFRFKFKVNGPPSYGWHFSRRHYRTQRPEETRSKPAIGSRLSSRSANNIIQHTEKMLRPPIKHTIGVSQTGPKYRLLTQAVKKVPRSAITG